jgi:hypothetical protein
VEAEVLAWSLVFVTPGPCRLEIAHERDLVELRLRERSDLLAHLEPLRGHQEQLVTEELPRDDDCRSGLAERPETEPQKDERARAPIAVQQLSECRDPTCRPERQPEREERERSP